MGNWKEDVSGAARLAVGSMANRYISDDIKDVAQLDAKSSLVEAMQQAFSKNCGAPHEKLQWHQSELRSLLAGLCADRGKKEPSTPQIASSSTVKDTNPDKDKNEESGDQCTSASSSTSESSSDSSPSSVKKTDMKMETATEHWAYVHWITAAEGPGKLHQIDMTKSFDKSTKSNSLGS